MSDPVETIIQGQDRYFVKPNPIPFTNAISNFLWTAVLYLLRNTELELIISWS